MAGPTTSPARRTVVGHTESEYVGLVPAPPLDRFIDDIYCLTGVPRHRRMNVPPMPSAHLFVNTGWTRPPVGFRPFGAAGGAQRRMVHGCMDQAFPP